MWMAAGTCTELKDTLAMGILSGYRVLDCSIAMAGPFAAQRLGDLGADVVKVEPVTGEWQRHTAAGGARGNKVNVIDYLGEQDAPNGGGPKLLGQVIEAKIGVPIHHYVRVDFESVKRLVDAMGGVEVDVDLAFGL